MAKQPDIQYINAYVSGSVAYKVEKKDEKKKVVLPKMRKKKRIVLRVDPAAGMGICVAAGLLVLLCVGFFRLRAAQAETRALADYVSSLQEEKQSLEAQYRAGYDLAEIEEIAKTMGFVPIGDVQKIEISVALPPEPVEEVTVWQSFRTFLAGLFA